MRALRCGPGLSVGSALTFPEHLTAVYFCSLSGGMQGSESPPIYQAVAGRLAVVASRPEAEPVTESMGPLSPDWPLPTSVRALDPAALTSSSPQALQGAGSRPPGDLSAGTGGAGQGARVQPRETRTCRQRIADEKSAAGGAEPRRRLRPRRAPGSARTRRRRPRPGLAPRGKKGGAGGERRGGGEGPSRGSVTHPHSRRDLGSHLARGSGTLPGNRRNRTRGATRGVPAAALPAPAFLCSGR